MTLPEGTTMITHRPVTLMLKPVMGVGETVARWSGVLVGNGDGHVVRVTGEDPYDILCRMWAAYEAKKAGL